MRIAIAVACVLALTSGANAYQDRIVKWTKVQAAGRFYFMPPADCMAGPLPPHKLAFLPQAEMNKRWPTNDPTAPDRFGMTFYAHSASNPFPYAVTFLPDNLPPKVKRDMIAHEMAHLRGCQHPGYVTHSDGTPVRH